MENLVITITLPLKKWESCDISYKKLVALCQRKIQEFRKKTLDEARKQTLKNPLIVPEADMYELCLKMLLSASKCRAKLLVLQSTKKGIVFELTFPDINFYKKFYKNFIYIAEKYGVFSQARQEQMAAKS